MPMSDPRPLRRFTVVGTTYLTVDADNEREVRALLNDVELVVVCEGQRLNVTPLRKWDISEDKMN